jgi:hypothetical protein
VNRYALSFLNGSFDPVFRPRGSRRAAFHRRHTRAGGYPVFKTTYYDFISQFASLTIGMIPLFQLWAKRTKFRIDVISVGAAFQPRLDDNGAIATCFRGRPATSPSVVSSELNDSGSNDSAEQKPLPREVGVKVMTLTRHLIYNHLTSGWTKTQLIRFVGFRPLYHGSQDAWFS